MTGDWRVIEASMRARGLWNEDGIARRARARLCPKCGDPIMVGLDADVAAYPAKCDPTPLNALGEVQALMTGRATWHLNYIGGRYEINYRYAEHIKAHPAGSDPRVEVLAEHKCGMATPVNLRGAYMDTPHTRKANDNDEPPF